MYKQIAETEMMWKLEYYMVIIFLQEGFFRPPGVEIFYFLGPQSNIENFL